MLPPAATLGGRELEAYGGGAVSLRSHKEAIRKPGALGRQENRRGERARWGGKGYNLKSGPLSLTT